MDAKVQVKLGSSVYSLRFQIKEQRNVRYKEEQRNVRYKEEKLLLIGTRV